MNVEIRYSLMQLEAHRKACFRPYLNVARMTKAPHELPLVLMTLKIQSSGFDLEAEISGLVRKNSLKHTEVHVEWGQRKGGVSKLRSLTDGFIILARIIRT